MLQISRDCLVNDMEYARFGELYIIPSSNGVSRPSAVRGEGYKMINMGELFANDIISDMPMERVQLSSKEKEKYLVKENDLLFARQSLVASGAGKCSIVRQLSEETTFESHLIRVRLDEQKYNPWYYYYLFQLPYNPIKTIVNQCAQAGIRGKELAKIKIPVPPHKMQNKIADILSRYDALIENNNKRIKVLEQVAESLYKEWFVHFRFPGYEDVSLKEQTPGGWVISSRATNMVCPEWWEYGALSRLGSFARGKNITAAEMVEGDIPVVSAGLEPSGYHNAHNVTGKSLTISASSANAGYLKYHLSDIWAADCSYFQDDGKLWFVYNALKFLQPVISNLQVGAAQPHVYPKNINKLCTIIPDNDTVQAYCNKVEPIYGQIRILKEKNANLTKQRDVLLPRLMSGKLEV